MAEIIMAAEQIERTEALRVTDAQKQAISEAVATAAKSGGSLSAEQLEIIVKHIALVT